MSAIVFMDTETTGLSLDDDIWEFAAIRREEDGTENEHHLFIEHDEQRCQRLPESFRTDHNDRFPAYLSPRIVSKQKAATDIALLFKDRPHVVGAVPNFDTERIALLLAKHGISPGWHYHLIDVENLAVGYLNGVRQLALDEGIMAPSEVRNKITLPWDSDALSRACGVEPPTTERHTAMGDARWAMALHDAIVGKP